MHKPSALVFFNADAAMSFGDHVMPQQVFPPSSEDSALCWCTLIDQTLLPNEHLDDCELLALSEELSNLTGEELSDTSSTTLEPSESKACVQKRKHRESMARLRHKLRASIATLKGQEVQLERILRHTVAAASSNQRAEPVNSLERLRLSYLELVEEQIELQSERDRLESTRAARDKYERLVQRELVRTFRVTEPRVD